MLVRIRCSLMVPLNIQQHTLYENSSESQVNDFFIQCLCYEEKCTPSIPHSGRSQERSSAGRQPRGAKHVTNLRDFADYWGGGVPQRGSEIFSPIFAD